MAEGGQVLSSILAQFLIIVDLYTYLRQFSQVLEVLTGMDIADNDRIPIPAPDPGSEGCRDPERSPTDQNIKQKLHNILGEITD